VISSASVLGHALRRIYLQRRAALFSSLIHPSLAKSPFTLNAEPMLHGPEEE